MATPTNGRDGKGLTQAKDGTPTIVESTIRRIGSFQNPPEEVSVTVSYVTQRDSTETEAQVVFDVDKDNVAYFEEVDGSGTYPELFIPIAYAAGELRTLDIIVDVANVPTVGFLESQFAGTPALGNNQRQPTTTKQQRPSEHQNHPNAEVQEQSSPTQSMPLMEDTDGVQRQANSEQTTSESASTNTHSQNGNAASLSSQETSGEPTQHTADQQLRQSDEADNPSTTDQHQGRQQDSSSDLSHTQELLAQVESEEWVQYEEMLDDETCLAAVQNVNSGDAVAIWSVSDNSSRDGEYAAIYSSDGERYESDGHESYTDAAQAAADWLNNPQSVG
jgi:hypothetical protein